MAPAILILVFSNLKKDARVTRQVLWASKLGRVTAVCFDHDSIDGVEFIKISQTKLTLVRKALIALLLTLRLHTLAYRLLNDYGVVANQLSSRQFDVVIANDIDTLPLAFRIRSNAKIVFDAHEYAPRHFEDNRIWKFFFQPMYLHFCNKYIPKTDAMFTVGRGLADEYAKHFRVAPHVITNAAHYHEITPSVVSAGKVRLVHHGIVNKSRSLELMIDAFEILDDRFSLDMYLLLSDFASAGTASYLEALKAKAKKYSAIRILPPIARDEIVSSLNRYDIGVFMLPPVNFNYANTLPNKLFDFIQARLAIAIGPSREMAEVVHFYRNGIVSEEFTAKSLADKLNQLTPEKIMELKAQSALAAKEMNAEQNEKLFSQVLSQLFKN